MKTSRIRENNTRNKFSRENGSNNGQNKKKLKMMKIDEGCMKMKLRKEDDEK
ncbi:hypothetical protein MTR_4g120430 [Medicago truncatula]|uniref:Uncharacterized protein n=1 Tax=Medicago truncatula TaxID=3880 RepID=A0A072URK2_MEDTR|nr:hypothetical protein MTR_4g120430 [Medicago truncatula]